MRLLRLALLMEPLWLLACSTGDAASEVRAQTLIVSSRNFYRDLAALPATGPESLVALFERFAAQTFPQYLQEQTSLTPDARVVLDGRDLGNPREQLLKNRGIFLDAATAFPTVGAWWRASGRTPSVPRSEHDYQQSLQGVWSGAELGLAFSGPCAELVQAMDTLWFGRPSPPRQWQGWTIATTRQRQRDAYARAYREVQSEAQTRRFFATIPGQVLTDIVGPPSGEDQARALGQMMARPYFHGDCDPGAASSSSSADADSTAATAPEHEL